MLASGHSEVGHSEVIFQETGLRPALFRPRVADRQISALPGGSITLYWAAAYHCIQHSIRTQESRNPERMQIATLCNCRIRGL